MACRRAGLSTGQNRGVETVGCATPCATDRAFGIVARMSEQIHLQQYQRFFAILLSVLPGLNLILGLAGLVLWLIADVAQAEWGLGIGLAGLTFAVGGLVWVVVGIGVRTWAEQKPTGLLFGACAPFLVLDVFVMGYLFYYTVIADHSEEAAETVMVVVRAVSQIV